jgi:hypothetical protein
VPILNVQLLSVIFMKANSSALKLEIGPDRRRGMGNENGAKESIRKLEFYWLCDRCAERMTVVSEKGMGVSVRPHFAASATAA